LESEFGRGEGRGRDLILGENALEVHLDGDAHGRGARALSRAALEHEELRVLDRELDVLVEVVGMNNLPTPSRL